MAWLHHPRSDVNSQPAHCAANNGEVPSGTDLGHVIIGRAASDQFECLLAVIQPVDKGPEFSI